MRRPPPVHPDHLAGGIILLGGVLVAGLGLAEVPRGWIIAGTAILTLAGVLAGNAAQAGITDASRVRALSGALGCVVVFVLGLAAYNLRFDPSRASGTRVWEFVLDGASEVECMKVYGEPGGQQITLGPGGTPLAPICGGTAHYVECHQTLDDGSDWYRLASSRYWLPASAVRPRAGSSVDGLATC
jgi:hypothetical protein